VVQVPIVFFSLLRKGTPDRDRSEAKLAEAFDYVSAGAEQSRSGSRLRRGEVATMRNPRLEAGGRNGIMWAAEVHPSLREAARLGSCSDQLLKR
jgi:hypothetical protein